MSDDDQPKLPSLLTPTALPEPACVLGDLEQDRPEFLHAVLCQVGLPRSRVTGRTFERSSGNASMLLEAGHVKNPWKGWDEVELPYGTKPRLMMFHICSEVVRTKRPEVNLGGSVRKFLDRIGLDVGGNQWKAFREQSRALAAMRMHLAYMTNNKLVQINTQPIERFEAWLHPSLSQGQLWPDELRVSHEFMDTLLEHAVPLEGEALHKLSGSALALDLYTWLAHRLCRVRKDGGIPLWWMQLRGQFGQEYKSDKDFKKEFRKALGQALKVYPDARVEEVKGGIRLYPSPPPVKRTNVVVKLAAPVLATPASVDQIRLLPETLEQVPSVAPGWDKYYLESLWREWISTKAGMPKYPDKAFLGWAKKFTKGKKPA